MRTLSVRIRAVFQPDDADAIAVLRIAACANDLDTLTRMLLEMKEDEAAHTKRRYVLRMSALHLSGIKDLVNHPDFDRVVTRCSRRRGFNSLPDLARLLRLRLNRGPLREVMGRARNAFGGHYDAALMAGALAKVEPWELMDLPGQGARHNVVDRLFDISFTELSHARYNRESMEESLKAAVEDLLDVHHALVPVVQGLVAGLYYEAEGF